MPILKAGKHHNQIIIFGRKKAEVFRYIKLHKTGVSNYSKKLFSILMWEEWYQRFYKQYT